MKIAHNSLFGLMGFAIPTMILLGSYPVLIRYLGADAFGIYIISTSISGALTFLDFGISSAAIKYVSEDLAKEDKKSAAEVIITALVFYGGIALIVSSVIWIISPDLVSWFSVEYPLREQAILLFRIAAVQFLIFSVVSVALSVFKAMQRFDLSTYIISFLTALTYGGSAAGVLFAGLGLVGVGLISLVANIIILCLVAVLGYKLCVDKGILLGSAKSTMFMTRRMLNFGAAMTVHTLAAIFFTQLQRLLIGILINPAAVTVYTLAYTVVSKSHAIVNAITEVLYPLSSGAQNRSQLRRIYKKMLLGSALLSALILVPLSVFAETILNFWVGDQLAREAAPLVPVLAAAFFIISLSPAPFHVVNGFGRPWINAAFDIFNVFLAVVMIGFYSVGGMTLMEFVLAFSIANIINGIIFQIVVEFHVWRTQPSV